MPPEGGKLFELLVLALLIGHAAAGLAGGLARGLALAAAAVLGALTEVAGLKSLDSFHNKISVSLIILPAAKGPP